MRLSPLTRLLKADGYLYIFLIGLIGPVAGIELLSPSHSSFLDVTIGAKGTRAYCGGNEMKSSLVWTCPIFCSSQERVPTITPRYTISGEACPR